MSTSSTTYRHPGGGMPDTVRVTLYRHVRPITGRILTSTSPVVTVSR